jgi:hypothetical protein
VKCPIHSQKIPVGNDNQATLCIIDDIFDTRPVLQHVVQRLATSSESHPERIICQQIIIASRPKVNMAAGQATNLYHPLTQAIRGVNASIAIAEHDAALLCAKRCPLIGSTWQHRLRGCTRRGFQRPQIYTPVLRGPCDVLPVAAKYDIRIAISARPWNVDRREYLRDHLLSNSYGEEVLKSITCNQPFPIMRKCILRAAKRARLPKPNSWDPPVLTNAAHLQQ